MELQFLSRQLNIDVFEREGGGALSGPFSETCVTDVLEADAFDFLEMVETFLGEIVASCSELSSTASVTKAYYSKLDFVNHLYGRKMRPGWTENHLSLLNDKSSASKKLQGKVLKNTNAQK